MSDRLRLRTDGDVLTITLDRPEARNALDETAIEDLTEAMRGPASEPDLRFVVLRGEGKAFCAGADLQYMRRLADADEETNVGDAERLGALFHAIATCPHPVIAAVHGAAIGGGVGLVAAADVVVATQGTRFGFTEVRLGIVPGVIAPYAVRRLGPATSRRLFLTGEIFDAEAARDFGLVDEIVGADALDATVAAWIERLRVGGPKAQTAVKQLLEDVIGASLHDAVARTPAHIARQRATDEAREGFASFFDKRPPSWSPEARS